MRSWGKLRKFRQHYVESIYILRPQGNCVNSVSITSTQYIEAWMKLRKFCLNILRHKGNCAHRNFLQVSMYCFDVMLTGGIFKSDAMEDIFKSNLIQISLWFVTKYPVDNKTALVSVINWRQAISWTKDDRILSHTWAPPGLRESMKQCTGLNHNSQTEFRQTAFLGTDCVSNPIPNVLYM